MPTIVNLRKILDSKKWEFMTPSPSATSTGALVSSSPHFEQIQLYINGGTTAWLYSPSEDAFVQIPSPGIASISAGSAGCAVAWSTGNVIATAGLTAIGGNTNSIETTLSLARDLRGYAVHILNGPNAGQTLTIRNNTIGASSSIYVDPQGLSFSNLTGYRLMTPTWYLMGGGGAIRKYDLATNTFTSVNAHIITPSTDGKFIPTPSWNLSNYQQFSTGTISATLSFTSFEDNSKNWVIDQWANYQVRIVSGTGAGQIRTIISNTASVITASPSFVVIPGNGPGIATYSIEGNDDYIYNIGNNAVTLYRYSISGNTWSTITPVVARSGTPTTGLSGHWITGVTVSEWTNENGGTGPGRPSTFTPSPWRGAPLGYLNGRYIYSFRGGAAAVLDVYDIAANTWIAATYAPATETFTTGTKYANNGRFIWIQQNATGRWFQYDVVTQMMDGQPTLLFTQGAAGVGETSFVVTYIDGSASLVYVYIILNTSTVLMRQLAVWTNPVLWSPILLSPALWLDASDTSTISFNGLEVQTWIDKSRNARNATQAIQADRPIYSPTAFNGLPTLQFDGVTENLNLTQFPQASDQWVFAVIDTTNLQTGYRIFMDRTSAAGTNPGFYLSSGDVGGDRKPMIFWNGADRAIQPSPVQRRAIFAWSLSTGVSASATTQVDGATAISASFSATELQNWNKIGSSSGTQHPQMNLSELVVVQSPTTAQIDLMNGYLAWKWGLTASLPSNHPYKNIAPYQ